MTDSFWKPEGLSATELADLQRRHVARGGRPVVRADSASAADQEMDSAGLFVHTTLDQANRPIREFELPEGQTKRSTWMGAHMAPAMLQIGLTNNVVETRRQAQRFMAEHGL